MAIERTQAFLACLYTDGYFRRCFFSDPQAVGKTFGMSEDEVRGLADLSARQINFFARSLQRKRLRAVQKLLPLTSVALGEGFSRLFFQYLDNGAAGGINKHYQDAICFGTFLRQLARTDEVDPDWSVDLAGYEAAEVEMSSPSRHWKFCRSRYTVDALSEGLASGTLPPHTRALVLSLWWRLRSGERVRRLSVALPRVIGKTGVGDDPVEGGPGSSHSRLV